MASYVTDPSSSVEPPTSLSSTAMIVIDEAEGRTLIIWGKAIVTTVTTIYKFMMCSKAVSGTIGAIIKPH
jgi:hypothetical protein